MQMMQRLRTVWVICLLALLAGPALAQLEPPLKRPEPRKTLDMPDPTPETRTFTVAVHEWSPWAGPRLQSMGPLPRMVSEIFSRDGTQVRFRFVHWSKALDMLAAKEVDAALIWVSGDLRLDPFLMSAPMHVQRAALYFHKSRPYSEDITSAAKGRLAWLPQYVYEFDVFRQIEKKTLAPVPVKDEQDGLRAVAHRQADLFITPLSVGRAQLARLDASERQSLGYVMLKNDFPPAFFLLNAGVAENEERMKSFNQGLRRLKVDGRYDKILATSP